MLENAIAMFLLHRLGFTEILIIVLIILVLFGPKFLPKLSKQVGKTVHDWQKVGEKHSTAPDGIIEVEPIELDKESEKNA